MSGRRWGCRIQRSPCPHICIINGITVRTIYKGDLCLFVILSFCTCSMNHSLENLAILLLGRKCYFISGDNYLSSFSFEALVINNKKPLLFVFLLLEGKRGDRIRNMTDDSYSNWNDAFSYVSNPLFFKIFGYLDYETAQIDKKYVNFRINI